MVCRPSISNTRCKAVRGRTGRCRLGGRGASIRCLDHLSGTCVCVDICSFYTLQETEALDRFGYLLVGGMSCILFCLGWRFSACSHLQHSLFRSDSVSIIGMDISAWDGGRMVSPTGNRQRNRHSDGEGLFGRGENTHGRPNSTDSNRFVSFFPFLLFFFIFFHRQGKRICIYA